MENSISIREYPIPDRMTIYQASMLWLKAVPKESLYEQLTHIKPDNYFHICNVIIRALNLDSNDLVEFELTEIPANETGVLEIHDSYAKKNVYLEVEFHQTDYPVFIEKGINIDVYRSYLSKKILTKIAKMENVTIQLFEGPYSESNFEELKVVFSKIKSKNDLKQNLESITRLIAPEMEKLWLIISEKINRDPRKVDEKLMVEICLDEICDGYYKIIKEKHINASLIFDFRERQERKDIIGKIIRAIIKDHYPGNYSYQEIGSVYQKQLKSSKKGNQ